jgi:hypothetical protein
VINKKKHQNDNSRAKPGILNMLPRESSLKFEHRKCNIHVNFLNIPLYFTKVTNALFSCFDWLQAPLGASRGPISQSLEKHSKNVVSSDRHL